MKVLAIASVLFFAVSARELDVSSLNLPEITTNIFNGFEDQFKGFLTTQTKIILKNAGVELPNPSLERKISALNDHFVSNISSDVEREISASVQSTTNSLKNLPDEAELPEVDRISKQHARLVADNVIPIIQEQYPAWSHRLVKLVNSDPEVKQVLGLGKGLPHRAPKRLAHRTPVQTDLDEHLDMMPLDRRSTVNLHRRDGIGSSMQILFLIVSLIPYVVCQMFFNLFAVGLTALFWPIFGLKLN